MNEQVICNKSAVCDASGRCPHCNGGKVYKFTSSTPEGMQSGKCYRCNGTGLVPASPVGMNLEQIKLAIKQWRDYNFPKATAESQLLGVVEELGELSHAHLKESQGIRKMDYRHAKQDAIGDMMIFLLNYCELQDLDVMECINIAWAEASKRDWVKYPKNGVSE